MVAGAAKRAMARLYDAVEAEYRQHILELLPQEPSATLLDVGCDDGEWTQQLQRRMGLPAGNVAGIEIVEERRDLAAARGYDVHGGSLEAAWPFEDGRFDFVHANQVIEHVRRLDHFAREVRRVLRPGGRAIVCTENLASWHNVGALVLGYMPFSLSNISDTGPVGNPFSLHAGETFLPGESWQHIHVLTTVGLRAIFTAHGFTVEHTFASGYYPAVGRLATRLARGDPRHAHFIGVVARLADDMVVPRC